jgi:hypothetical protein
VKVEREGQVLIAHVYGGENKIPNVEDSVRANEQPAGAVKHHSSACGRPGRRLKLASNPTVQRDDG